MTQISTDKYFSLYTDKLTLLKDQSATVQFKSTLTQIVTLEEVLVLLGSNHLLN